MEEETGLSKQVAVIACAGMAFFYVAILYAPTLILRLPPPSSLKEFMIRRFICAAISSIVSLLLCAFILPIPSMEASIPFGIYGIRLDHIWQAVVFPLSLTSLMYAGSFVLKLLLLVDSWKEHVDDHGGGFSFNCINHLLQDFITSVSSTASNILAWRNYVVAPLTEELVFRACMIPLLLCGRFKISSVIFLCPVLFSLGLQLGYTVIFGSYASFLYIRTGHLVAPLVAHIFCNFMGLPVLFARRTGMVSLAFVAGVISFLWLLFPVTRPDLYNDRTNSCRCWHGYCSGN